MPYCDKILEASEPFIDQIVKREDLKEKRFLITGATGHDRFIGFRSSALFKLKENSMA